MANGVIVPVNGKYINSELVSGTNLRCRDNNCVLTMEGLALTSSTSYASLVPSDYCPSNATFGTALFVNGSTYKMGYINLATNGTLYGYIVENGSYVTPTGYTIYGELSWCI